MFSPEPQPNRAERRVRLVFNLAGRGLYRPEHEEPHFDHVADPQPKGRHPLPINSGDEGHDGRSPRTRKKRAGAASLRLNPSDGSVKWCSIPAMPLFPGEPYVTSSVLRVTKEISMVEKTLSDLFLAHMKDIYYAEKKIFRTLPKMVKAAQGPELKTALTTHREETQGHIERLEQVFEMIGKRPQTKPCEAINGIVAEGEETIEEFGESRAIDTGLVAAGQAVEHYEMARYGALAAWARQLGMPQAAALFDQTLQEEMKAEKLLTQIGASKADKTAATKIAA
jgi:ferritin-like metal-binding protein YciE